MYIPKYYREEDRQKILAFLKQNNFAALVTFDGEKPIATHTSRVIAAAISQQSKK